jgi:hypothetical protein
VWKANYGAKLPAAGGGGAAVAVSGVERGASVKLVQSTLAESVAGNNPRLSRAAPSAFPNSVVAVRQDEALLVWLSSQVGSGPSR